MGAHRDRGWRGRPEWLAATTDRVFVVGKFRNDLEGDGTETALNTSNVSAFLWALGSANGDTLFLRGTGGDTEEFATGAAATDDALYAGVRVAGASYYANDQWTSAGGEDALVLALGPDTGNLLWSYQLGGAGNGRDVWGRGLSQRGLCGGELPRTGQRASELGRPGSVRDRTVPVKLYAQRMRWWWPLVGLSFAAGCQLVSGLDDFSVGDGGDGQGASDGGNGANGGGGNSAGGGPCMPGSAMAGRGFEGGGGEVVTRTIATNADGEVAVGIGHDGALRYDGVTVPGTNAGMQDTDRATIMLFAPSPADAQPLWSVTLHATEDVVLEELGFDTSGNLYACGRFIGALFTGTTQHVADTTPSQRGFVVQIVNGMVTWTEALASDATTRCAGLTVGTDAVYVTGQFDTSLYFGNGDSITLSGGTTSFAGRVPFSGSGANYVGLATSSVGVSIDGTPDGGFVVVGSYFDNTAFGVHPLTFDHDRDAFAVKLSAELDAEWARRLHGQGVEQPEWVAANDTGIYVAGRWNEEIRNGSDRVPGDSDDDGFVWALGHDGSGRWMNTLAGASDDNMSSIAVTDTAVYVVGSMFGTASYKMSSWDSAGASDGLALALDHQNGNLRWSYLLGGNGSDRAWTVHAGQRPGHHRRRLRTAARRQHDASRYLGHRRVHGRLVPVSYVRTSPVGWGGRSVSPRRSRRLRSMVLHRPSSGRSLGSKPNGSSICSPTASRPRKA